MKRILAIILTSLIIFMPASNIFATALEEERLDNAFDVIQEEVSIKKPVFISEKSNNFLDEINTVIDRIYNDKYREMMLFSEENNANFTSIFMGWRSVSYNEIISVIINNGVSIGNTYSNEVNTLVFNFNEGKFYTLKDFLGDNAYNIATEEVKNQMNINNDEYFMEQFKGVDSSTSFYINEDGKVVIVFDKYEIAAGVYGNPEFIIPINK